MKKLMIRLGIFFLFYAALLFTDLREVWALQFIDTVSFAVSDHNYTTVAYPANQSSGFSWDHALIKYLGGYSLEDIDILNLKLSVTFSQTNTSEDWSIEGVGRLSAASAMTQNEFGLEAFWSADLLDDGKIRFVMLENTPGADSFRLYNSKLSGVFVAKSKYPEVPEPGTWFCFLTGLGILRLFKSGRAHDVT